MNHYRIAPKEYISEKYVQNYYNITKMKALELYKNKFPQLTTKELQIT